MTDLPRRLLVGAGVALVPLLARAQPGRTPGQILGPFFPVQPPGDSDWDLTRVRGRAGQAAGRLVDISGRVLDEAGQPVPNARIVVWQANAAGRYAHPADRNAAPLDPAFAGSARITADRDGRYAFRTVRPGAYPDDGGGGMRAPHIHFDVTGRSDRLVTQAYFPGDPLNDADRVLAFALQRRERLMMQLETPARSGQPERARWDIVLRKG